MILITGLGPGDLARIPGPVLDLLLDEQRVLVVRTVDHPAARDLAGRREITFCDDLYESLNSFEDVYGAIAERVVSSSRAGDVIYAVPGSPMIGEFAVRRILEEAQSHSIEVEIIPAESFVDAVLAEVGYDPFERGLEILNGHDLADPVVIDKPTIIGHLDRPEILADVSARLSRLLPETTEITVLRGLGSNDFSAWSGPPDQVDPALAGYRTSIWVDAEPGGLAGAIRTMSTLRRECPWDREQTHQSLTKNLIEESYELLDAISELDLESDDVAPYAKVEEELGDVLLQVLFHANIASEAGAFDINDVGEVLRQKLVRRHPHVFGDVEVSDASEVKANWDRIKAEENGPGPESAMEGIPKGMPALHRASKVLNRAAKSGAERPSMRESLSSARTRAEVLGGSGSVDGDALGELLFDLVDVARQSGLDPELLLARATKRFEEAFSRSEQDHLG